MSLNSLRAARHHLLESAIRRLDRRIAVLQIISDRVSWVRAAIVLIGLPLAYVAFTGNALAGWGTLVATLIFFGVAVRYHRRLEGWVDTFEIGRDLKSDHLARMTLDWENIRSPSPLDLTGKRARALDLDLTGPRSLHQLLDTTASRRGSQLIADWLVPAQPDIAATLQRQQIVRELTPLTRFRDRFHLTFYRVLRERMEGTGLLEWLKEEFSAARLRWVLPLALLWVILNIALFILYALANWPAYWVVSLIGYFVLYLANQSILSPALEAMTRLDAELDRLHTIFRYLETYPYSNQPQLAQLCAPFREPGHRPSAQIRPIKIVTTAVSLRSNPLLGVLLNLVSPWDFILAALGNHYRAQVAQALPVWIDLCQQLDALIALADFGYLNPEYTFPELVLDARPVLAASSLGHPLIPYPAQVRNDLTLQAPGHVDIITGSNMAGKSTFLKTVGVNLCLALAGAPVDAASFRAVPFRLYTCIRITDSIVDGFSYFYAEVKSLKGLLNTLQAPNPLPLLYLIDEIFRGTNNRERLIGSRAYIRAIAGKNGCGLLATHDLELARLAEGNPQIHNAHFQDEVVEGRLVFDYKLRPGPSPTTNALRIMQMEGLPIEPEELTASR
ncbi:MAG: hypothetical protein WCF84_07585 [Anaerolineae bacterium]